MISNKIITIKNILFSLLIILAVISLSQGVLNALTNSQDFQWSPTLLLRTGINPFNYVLNDVKHEKIIMTQIPNYFHGLYVIFLPFTFLNWEKAKLFFVFFNILITIHTIYNFTQHFKLNSSFLILIITIYFSSTSFIVSLGNGHQNIFILYCFATKVPDASINSELCFFKLTL